MPPEPDRTVSGVGRASVVTRGPWAVQRRPGPGAGPVAAPDGDMAKLIGDTLDRPVGYRMARSNGSFGLRPAAD